MNTNSIWRSRISTTPPTKTKSPQTQQHRRALPQDHARRVLRIAFRKKIYTSIEDLQADLDLDARVQRGQAPSGKMVLRKDPDADAVTLCRSQEEKSLQVTAGEQSAAP